MRDCMHLVTTKSFLPLVFETWKLYKIRQFFNKISREKNMSGKNPIINLFSLPHEYYVLSNTRNQTSVKWVLAIHRKPFIDCQIHLFFYSLWPNKIKLLTLYGAGIWQQSISLNCFKKLHCWIKKGRKKCFLNQISFNHFCQIVLQKLQWNCNNAFSHWFSHLIVIQ